MKHNKGEIVQELCFHCAHLVEVAQTHHIHPPLPYVSTIWEKSVYNFTQTQFQWNITKHASIKWGKKYVDENVQRTAVPSINESFEGKKQCFLIRIISASAHIILTTGNKNDLTILTKK